MIGDSANPQEPTTGSRLRGQTAVITGAAAGIGAAIAECFAHEGARLVLCDRDSSGDGFAKRLRAEFVQCDVSDAVGVETLREFVQLQSPRFDVVVANAGVSLSKPFDETTPTEWNVTIQGNLTATYLTCLALLPMMAQQRAGCVVAVASQLGLVGNKGSSAYGAAKAGVINLVRTLAAEYASLGIRINALCPGPTRTPLLERLIAGGPDPEEVAKRMAGKTLLNRLADPREIANAALFLASNESSYVTGAVLAVDGGHTAI
jgi:2-keto-3-deoxy-L-fuconate dehydrogenase